MLGVAVVALLPPIWVAATTLVAEEDMTTTIRGERVEASVPVPAGWAMRPTFADESRVTLTSPDGRMQVDLAVRDAGDPVVTLGDIAPRPLDALSRERTVAGQELLHANTADGELIVGVVVSGDALLTFVSGPRQGYDAELAELLAEIDVSQIGVTGGSPGRFSRRGSSPRESSVCRPVHPTLIRRGRPFSGRSSEGC